MPGQTEFGQLLEAGDVDALRWAWCRVAPNMPQPESREKAEIVMHVARTGSSSLTLKARAYSHAWLLERNLPSQLPDSLKPTAERMYPRTVEAVGLSLNFRHEFMKPAQGELEGAINGAIEDMYASSRSPDVQQVRSRMAEVKRKTMRALFG